MISDVDAIPIALERATLHRQPDPAALASDRVDCIPGSSDRRIPKSRMPRRGRNGRAHARQRAVLDNERSPRSDLHPDHRLGLGLQEQPSKDHGVCRTRVHKETRISNDDRTDARRGR